MGRVQSGVWFLRGVCAPGYSWHSLARGDASASLANLGFNYLFLCLHAGGRGIFPSFPAP